jgi:hypothetical protein
MFTIHNGLASLFYAWFSVQSSGSPCCLGINQYVWVFSNYCIKVGSYDDWVIVWNILNLSGNFVTKLLEIFNRLSPQIGVIGTRYVEFGSILVIRLDNISFK